MNKRMISLISILLLIVLAGTLLASCGSSSSPATTSSGGSSDGQTLMQTRCSVCHSVDRVTSAHKTADQWKTTADRMISHGAQLTPQEEQTLIDYLTQNYK
jgi:mono/diheme cytochrome c family protein